ncbi:hypothetical protein O3M35_010489 [Rhynocoris fuscipes]|uniref:Solute carrier organic anion transporter family member n=1 Tax=Rhynocoris fuscipes TaxID=488301 RepID=A0AAW1D642_9HEMI
MNMSATIFNNSEEKNEEAVEELLLDSNNQEQCNDNIQTLKANSVQEEKDNNESTRCGVFGWFPNWLQLLASKKSYVVAYGLLGMNHSALSAYFIGTISTIEKRFKLPSTTSGIINSAWDVGGIAALIVLAYFGSAGHKTRWVASGALLSALSCYLRYMPHVLYGPGSDVINYSANNTLSNMNLCNESGIGSENCSLNSEGMVTFIILVAAQFIIGVGTSTYYTLGVAYLDDNCLKNKFPFLLAAAAFIRYFGPTLGFLLSSYTLSIFIDTDQQPPFKQDDHRWIGAWHLGWLIFGTTEIILASFIAFFPKILPREAERRKISGHQDNAKVRSMADFKETIMRLLKNPILILNTFSSTFYIFGLMGYWIFMPKYIETQFRKTASAASLITGTVGLTCSAVGIMISGSVISKFKPRPTYLAAWNVITETFDFLGYFSFAFLGCLKDDLYGSYNTDGSWNTTDSCNAECDCSATAKYTPVCSADHSTTFYSPCHAGCTAQSIINGTKIFQNCSCISDFGEAIDGACPVDCQNNFVIFLAILCLMKFLSSTGRAGNTIIQFRAVLPDDKAISIAFSEVVLGVFTFVPAPILYGWLLDSSCLIWGVTCGKTGNCWLYDGRKLRYLLNFTASSFLFVAVLFDIGVWWKVGTLKLYDDESEVDSKEKENGKTKEKKSFFSLSTFTNAFSD